MDTDGKKVSLSDLRGRFVVVEFGCMTCAPAVGQISGYERNLSKLVSKFAPRVEFLMVYTREAHPGERIRSHRATGEKVEHAKIFKELENVKLHVLIDSVDGRVHKKYGNLPNMIYIINKEGRIVYKASWTDSREIEEVLENLLLWEKEGFTPMDSVAVVQKYHFIRDQDVELRRRVYARAGQEAIEDLKREINLKL